MKKLLVILLLGILLFGCIGEPQKPPVNTSNTTVAVAKLGDTVAVDYTLRLANGSIIDSSVLDDAKTGGIFDSRRDYQPLVFQIKDNNGLIKGFTAGVVGMKVGETKIVTVPPEQGYGVWDPTKTEWINATYVMPINQSFPRTYVESNKIQVSKGQVVRMSFGLNMEIVDFDNSTVYMRWMVTDNLNESSNSMGFVAAPGKKFSYYNIPSQIDSVGKDDFTIRWLLETNQSYTAMDSEGNQDSFKVLAIDGDLAELDRNGLLAGETLYFTLTLRSITQ
jgi:FKBP-type peptidyl-prolyl cis-trans isomerase 2